MKIKKFLKLIKKICKEENCVYGKCPLASKLISERGTIVADCMMAIENVDEWDIDDICKRVKEFNHEKMSKL